MIGELIAVIDETVPEVGAGVHYVLTTAVTLSPIDLDLSLAQLFSDTPGRKRPFHWHKEGPAARNRITEIIIEHGVVAHSRYQTVGRRGQRNARQLLLADLSTDLHLEGVDHLIIESVDDVTNGRDKRTLLDSFESSGGVPFAYDWRSKSERTSGSPTPSTALSTTTSLAETSRGSASSPRVGSSMANPSTSAEKMRKPRLPS